MDYSKLISDVENATTEAEFIAARNVLLESIVKLCNNKAKEFQDHVIFKIKNPFKKLHDQTQ